MKSCLFFKNKKYISVGLSLLLSFLLLLSGSVAWLCSVFKIEPYGEFAASSIAAYFADGDGSKEHPYEIEKPVHLYNLAWLQYLGFFNDDADGDGKIEQTYFVLNNDVDMDGLIIPPIGTEENPFIGNFNGNGCCVTGATVSNYVSQTEGDGGVSQMPSSVTDIDSSINDEKDKSIIGFFGVVGDWNDTLAGKIADDTQENLDIPSKVNAVYDLRLDGITVRSDTDESLMGLLAGYVNGSLQNVGIGSGALVTGNDLKPLNISGLEMQTLVSHYSLIGEYNEEDVAWPQRPVLGGWGDSINMMDMYDRLSKTVWPESKSVSYTSAETITYDAAGNVISRTADATATDNKIRVVDKGTLGNYSFSTNSDNASSVTYMYLYGPSTHTKQVTHRRPTNRTGDYIYVGSNFLSIYANNTATTIQSAPQASADTWTLTQEGHLYTVKNNTAYYLNRDTNGNLSVSATASTVWHRDINENTGSLYCTVNGVNYHLFCDAGTWKLFVTGANTYYTISNGTYYLNISTDGAIESGNAADTATRWTASNTDPVSGTFNANGYYLTTQRTGSWSYTYTPVTNTTDGTDFESATTADNKTQLYVSLQTGWFSRDDFYLSCSNTAVWSFSTTNNDNTKLVLNPVTIEYTADDFALGFDRNHLMNDEYIETQENVPYTTDTNATWFPLGIEQDENGNEYVSAGNTGYVVSSSDYQHSNAPQKSGNIRVSQYERSDISQSLTSSNLDHSKIYTISYKNKQFSTVGSLENAETTWGFTKYADSFAKFDETVKSDANNYIYGLHFMETTNNISKDHKITIDGAKVLLQDGLSHTYDGYELPRNAITFNVAEDGYINFFAGTFFSGNENFFSLHHVLRDDSKTKLQSIKEIAGIYGMFKNGVLDEYEPYVYKYTDGTFSKGYTAIPANYDLIFDTKWITDQATIGMRDNRVYYFEVPVNAGEYALGSVAGNNGDGAYLLYLDLAANGSRKVADDPEHAMMGVNFVDDAGLELTDISTYPIMSAQLALNEGVTTHGGVTAAYDRQSLTEINYQLSGAGANNFTLTFVSDEETSATEAPVTVNPTSAVAAPAMASLLLSRRRRQ